MGHRDVERLGRLSEQRTTAWGIDCARDYGGQVYAVLGAVLVEGEQARLEHENVVTCFHRQKVHAAGNQRLDLGIVTGHKVIKRISAAGLVWAARFDIEGLVGRPDTA